MPAPLGNLDDATSGIGRREWIRLGGLGLGSLGMTDLLARRSLAANADPTFGRAKACIVLFITGGPPQHETFDPKPDAPAEVLPGTTPPRGNSLRSSLRRAPEAVDAPRTACDPTSLDR